MANKAKGKDALEFEDFDSLFGEEPKGEGQVCMVAPHLLLPFKEHPFQVKEDEDMDRLRESIRENGILLPLIVRPVRNGSYEIISGHRRKFAGEKEGLEEFPVIVKEYSDDEAIIIMIDSNLQREHLLYSEKAFALKMKLEALKRQGKRNDLTCGQVVHKLNQNKSRDDVAGEQGMNGKQVQRLIRLTYLLPDLLGLVDEEKMPFMVGYTLSFLSGKEQGLLYEVMTELGKIPSIAQAEHLKAMASSDSFSKDYVRSVFEQAKTSGGGNLSLKRSRLTEYFPENYTKKEMEDVIFTLLQEWHEKQEVV